VRHSLAALLVQHLGAKATDLKFEKTLLTVRGRVDALLGRTVFEIKRDLRQEGKEAERQLTEYLGDRERATGQSFVGVATDGVDFIPYELRRGKLVPRRGFMVKRGDLHGLALWLSPFVAARPDVRPDPVSVRAELGRESLVYEVAAGHLRELWDAVHEDPEVAVKRKLWAERLQLVYGSAIDDDELFFQHTYLTIVAKTMATLVLGAEVPPSAADLLAGKPFHEAGIDGVIESDFFDWILDSADADDLVKQIAAQVGRFRLADIQHDVLKGLYESLIDPRQRHDLGEYYTPDWLAQWICERAVGVPLEQRVLDPACGSGTFLFHAVRRLLAAADAAGLSNADALARCTRNVLGIDVHPVAVINARITYLLAIGETRLRSRPRLSIPVYLGDSLQWNTEEVVTSAGLRITVPPKAGALPPPESGDRRRPRPPEALVFPIRVARDPALLDATISEMLQLSEQGASEDAFRAWLDRQNLGDEDLEIIRRTLVKTYATLRELHAEHRDHIWGYVARNLARPV
jgi:SAM-dependent methyltransferase